MITKTKLNNRPVDRFHLRRSSPKLSYNRPLRRIRGGQRTNIMKRVNRRAHKNRIQHHRKRHILATRIRPLDNLIIGFNRNLQRTYNRSKISLSNLSHNAHLRRHRDRQTRAESRLRRRIIKTRTNRDNSPAGHIKVSSRILPRPLNQPRVRLTNRFPSTHEARQNRRGTPGTSGILSHAI